MSSALVLQSLYLWFLTACCLEWRSATTGWSPAVLSVSPSSRREEAAGGRALGDSGVQGVHAGEGGVDLPWPLLPRARLVARRVLAPAPTARAHGVSAATRGWCGQAGQAAAHALSSGGTSPRATYSLYVRSRFRCNSAAICASSDGAASSLLAMLERRTPLRTAAKPHGVPARPRRNPVGLSAVITTRHPLASCLCPIDPRACARQGTRCARPRRRRSSVRCARCQLRAQRCVHKLARMPSPSASAPSSADSATGCRYRTRIDSAANRSISMGMGMGQCAPPRGKLAAYRPLPAPPRPRAPPQHRLHRYG